jgi:hypothetical protein
MVFNSIRPYLLLLPMLMLLLLSCRKYLKHERWISNASSQTITVINPDFDSVYTILPGEKAMIHAYERLSTKHDMADSCGWAGDTLFISTLSGDTCQLAAKAEGNWTSTGIVFYGPHPNRRDRTQTCTLTITDDDF